MTAKSAPRPAQPRSGKKDEIARLRDELESERRDKAELLIENGRLRSERGALTEVLRVIRRAPTDLQVVLDTIVESAARLCDADDVSVTRAEGDFAPTVAQRGAVTAAMVDATAALFGRAGHPIARHSISGRAMLDRTTVHVRDLASDWDDPAYAQRLVEATGVRTMLAVPLLVEGTAIGAIQTWRREVRPFTDRHIGLLQSFADQAVIAIENARLFSELQERLEEQTATAVVLRAISAAPADLERVLGTIAEAASRLCRGDDSVIHRIEGEYMVAAARSHSALGATLGARQRFTERHDSASATAIRERRTVHVPDLEDSAAAREFPVSVEAGRRYGNRAFVVTPLLFEGRPIGSILVRRRRPGPFTPRQIELLETFADQAVIALQNARLFSELQESNGTLREALEQQTATGDILRVIASSPTDVAPVLGAIVESAVRLVDATTASLSRVVGGARVIQAISTRMPGGAGVETRTGDLARLPLAGNMDLPAERALHDRRTIHLPDLAALTPADGYNAEWIEGLIHRAGSRTLLAVPLVREDVAVGALVVRRSEARAFSDSEIALLETFAAQAAIAIENTRLFTELRERDERRHEELERAASIQQRLLPSAVQGWPGALEVAVRFRPAVETSGDFYDVLRLTPAAEGALPPLQIAVGDVAGKGMAAALVTALARSALRASESVPTAMASPAGTLRAAGQHLHRDVGGQHFVACALAVVEPPGLHHAGPLLRLANAAQVPVLLARDGRADDVEPAGYRLPLGAQADGAYKDAEVELRPGDVVIFSSDGLVEAPALPTATVGRHLSPSAQEGELFGFERLAASASHWSTHAETAEAVAYGIWTDLTAWCGDESHHDDMTLLVLRVPQ